MIIYQTLVTSSPSNSSQYYSDIIVLLFIAFILFRRISRGLNGRTYSKARVLRIPIIYGIFTSFFLIELLSNLSYALIAIMMVIPGLIVGAKFGSLSTIYEENGKIMYRRSPIIMLIWAALFIIRIYYEFFLKPDLFVNFLIDSLLAMSLGVLMGEAYHLLEKHREFMENRTMSGEGASLIS